MDLKQLFILILGSTWLGIIFILGYVLGKNGYEAIPEVTKRLQKALDNSPVGVVKRPSAKILFYRKNPKLKETEDEMKKAFEKIKDEQQ